jgi:hypothetical protein
MGTRRWLGHSVGWLIRRIKDQVHSFLAANYQSQSKGNLRSEGFRAGLRKWGLGNDLST